MDDHAQLIAREIRDTRSMLTQLIGDQSGAVPAAVRNAAVALADAIDEAGPPRPTEDAAF